MTVPFIYRNGIIRVEGDGDEGGESWKGRGVEDDDEEEENEEEIHIPPCR